MSDSFPGPAMCISKLDLLKGYWQVPLTERASDISAFVTPDAFMQYTVYLDDVVVYSDDWESHMSSLKITLNLAKCEFGKATVTSLGKQVGHGQVRPVAAKVAAVVSLLVPSTRRELRRFLGMAGYYGCFCKNVSVVVASLD